MTYEAENRVRNHLNWQPLPRLSASDEQHKLYLASRLLAGHIVSGLADLSIADHLSEGGLTAREIATREGARLDFVLEFMRAGVAVGLMTLDLRDRFHGTESLAMLRKNAPGRRWALTIVRIGIIGRLLDSDRARRIALN
jgi:hypothetical protein